MKERKGIGRKGRRSRRLTSKGRGWELGRKGEIRQGRRERNGRWERKGKEEPELPMKKIVLARLLLLHFWNINSI